MLEQSENSSRIWVHSSALESTKKQPTWRTRSSSKLLPTDDTTSTTSCSSDSMGRSVWAWQSAYLMEHKADVLRIKILNEVYEVPSSCLENHTVVYTNDTSPDDLITLTHLHEPAILEALRNRYDNDIIYTTTGPVLLALNPFQNIRNLYGESVIQKYQTTTKPLKPHVYKIAGFAYSSMMRNLEDGTVSDQSILVSGESGSGKTVTTKFVMKYLASLSQKQQQPATRAYKRASQPEASQPTTLDSHSIEGRVLQSNPILEAFGNARTVRNDNSSRFGKFMELQFDNGKLVGATVETYLLEKVRIVSQNHGERNYHIFYCILTMDARPLSQLYLAKSATPEDFKMTASGTYTRRDGVSDADTFRDVKSALSNLEFASNDLFKVTAALLHISNLTFVEASDESVQLDETNVHVIPVCKLLGVDYEHLNLALCHCKLQAGGQSLLKSRTVSQAHTGLEGLLKETYAALFQYLVNTINDITTSNSLQSKIGVLDIFGFESFQVNSFEQLCINYCNEALQQQFNAYILENEQKTYKAEGISWEFIEFPENQDVLDLVEKRGILNILDDQCRAPGPSDKALAIQIYDVCQGPRFAATRPQQASHKFTVLHYAGPVEYSMAGFIKKNKDELPKETVELLKSSKKELVVQLAAVMEASKHTVSATPRKQLFRSDSSVGRPTVGGQFRRQLRSLRQKIDKTCPHYIRCLKPNDNLVPDHFDDSIVAEQLKCGGIIEAVRVARAGFTQHYMHADFVRRYKSLAWKELAKSASYSSTPNFLPQTEPRKNRNYRQSYSLPSYVTPTREKEVKKKPKEPELSPEEAKIQCRTLIKILCRKIQGEADDASLEKVPVVKATTYKTPISKVPSWSRQATPPSTPSPSKVSARYSPWKAKREEKRTEPPVSPSRRWSRATPEQVGIQMGKTKVFLRHKAFEALERVRGAEQTKAATKLNSIFRRYLARIAYLPYRAAFRQGMRNDADEYKESKEQDFGDEERLNMFQKARSFHSSYHSESLVDKWTELKIKEALHNPIPRHEWGKQAPDAAKFKWVIRDGLWVKNYQLRSPEEI